MAREIVSATPGPLRMSIAAGALAGVVASAHDVLLRGGDLTKGLATFVTHGAMGAIVYTVLAALVAIPLVLIARPFVREAMAGHRRAAVGAWWLAAAALAVLALGLPPEQADWELSLLGYVAMVPIALLGVRALQLVAADGASAAQVSGLYAGGLAGVPAAFLAVRAATSSAPVPEALGGVVVVFGAIFTASVAMIAVRGVFAALSGRIGHRRAMAVVIAIIVAPVAVVAVVGLGRELGQPGLTEKLAALSRGQGASEDAPSVILISVDTLRADSVGYAGGDARTPTIDALAEQSWVFESAYSVAPWTRPSFASFFSSSYPSEMGVARAESLVGTPDTVIPYAWGGDAPVLAELLEDEGYLTAAVTGNALMSEVAGVSRGFDAFHNCRLAAVGQFRPQQIGSALDLVFSAAGRPEPLYADFERADRIAQSGIKLMEALSEADGPGLAWMHFMDPHDPYDSPRAAAEEKMALSGYPIKAGFFLSGSTEREWTRAAYAAEIEYFDEWLAEVIDSLRETGLWDRSVVVFWSDHGEEFWEHKGWGHGQSLYRELLHVPLLIHMPGQTEARIVSDPVSLLDVTPTLLDLCGAPVPDEMHGRSLTPVLEGRPEEMEPLSVYLEGCLYGSIHKGLLRDRYKLIHDLYTDTYELYDLQTDPTEHMNLYGTPGAPDITRMKADLAAFTEQSLATMEGYAGRQPAGEMSQEVLDSLRDMGYIQ